jgi:hypothetical protein
MPTVCATAIGMRYWDRHRTDQKTGNVRIKLTLRRVRATIVAAEKQ